MHTMKNNLLSKRRKDPVAQERLIDSELDKFKTAIPEAELPALPREVRTMLQCIHACLFDPALKVFEVKRRCGVKNNNISTTFKRALGRGIREYIEDLRLQAAERLLAHEGLDIFLIGSAIGYAYEESFTRAFRRRLGCSPSAYRKEINQKKC